MTSEPAARIRWAELGWRPLHGEAPAPEFSGPLSVLVIAPWCPDCRESIASYRKSLQGSVWLAGEFDSPDAILGFAHEFRLDWPVLAGTGEKTEKARDQARFRLLREAWGDERRWGVPLLIEGRLEKGWLIAERLSWPS